MNTTGYGGQDISSLLGRFKPRRGLLFGGLIIAALLAFEVFNYSTTDFALRDLLGDLQFLGIHWATILAIAFCGIDFAGIARLFTPEEGANEPAEVWYLFGAWMLAATMNAMLTWWGVSLAILGHETLGNAVVERTTLIRVVPIFVAILVWLIRVLIIGTFSVAGDRLFSQTNVRPVKNQVRHVPISQPAPARTLGSHRPAQSLNTRANPVSASPSTPLRTTRRESLQDGHYNREPRETGHNRPEPTYVPTSAESFRGEGNEQQRKKF